MGGAMGMQWSVLPTTLCLMTGHEKRRQLWAAAHKEENINLWRRNVDAG
jgi:hypothetical protein